MTPVTVEVSVASNQEDYSSRQIHPECELSHDSYWQVAQFPFVVYILCDQLKNGMGNAFIDTGSQVSLVAENGLARGLNIKKQVFQIHGINGNVMETKGQNHLRIGETSPHEFQLVGDLPMNCDILLGQDCLDRFGYQFQMPHLGINLPAYSETLVRIPTNEKRSGLVEAQELQENVFLWVQCSEVC